jgi:hypothetical protein
MTQTKNPSRIGSAGRLAVLLALLPVALLAKDFWEEKPFTSWTEKEAGRILSDSPWGKIQTVSLLSGGWGPGEVNAPVGRVPSPTSPPGGGRAGGGGDATGGDARRDSASGQNVPQTGPAGGYSGETGAAPQSIPFQITWFSSIKVRQAMGRLGQLQGSVSPEQVNSFVQQPVTDYIIAISGPSMKPFEQASLQSLKSKTFLVSKKNKNKKLELKEYVSPKDRKDGLALFTFPRQVEGNPSLEPTDEEAQFVTEVAGLQIKTNFKLSKMMTEGKLDL